MGEQHAARTRRGAAAGRGAGFHGDGLLRHGGQAQRGRRAPLRELRAPAQRRPRGLRGAREVPASRARPHAAGEYRQKHLLQSGPHRHRRGPGFLRALQHAREGARGEGRGRAPRGTPRDEPHRGARALRAGADVPRGGAVRLVHPARAADRVERALPELRAARPVPLPVLPTRHRGRQDHARAGARAPQQPLDQEPHDQQGAEPGAHAEQRGLANVSERDDRRTDTREARRRQRLFLRRAAVDRADAPHAAEPHGALPQEHRQALLRRVHRGREARLRYAGVQQRRDYHPVFHLLRRQGRGCLQLLRHRLRGDGGARQMGLPLHGHELHEFPAYPARRHERRRRPHERQALRERLRLLRGHDFL